MQLILKPVSHPDLGEIVIRDRLFPIGRQEPPFTSYGPDVIAKLSRRHARIFEQDDITYLVDLDSLNGTTINGKPLEKEPVELRQNDEICFAGYLTYSTQLLGSSVKTNAGGEKLPAVLLTLIPKYAETLLEPIVVSEFPFLISKSDDTFARYREQFPDEYKFLSRRHAHIFTRDQDLLIEDLGSTNGTFVSDSRLDEHARILHDDDSIAFGGNHFIYNVRITHIKREPGKPLDDPSVLTDGLNTATDITRTTFITSASSFIDIFCSDDKDEENAPADDEVSQAVPDGPGKKQGTRAATIRTTRQPSRIGIFLRELRRAFSDEQRLINRRVLWSGVIILLGVAGLIGFSYYQGVPKRTIEQYLNEGDYIESAKRADAYLEQHPRDEEVSELAVEAVLRFAIPSWQQQLYANEFLQARNTVAEARSLSTHNPSIMPLLDLLDWVIELEEFMLTRGGTDAPILLFHHEDRIQGLLSWWDKNKKEHQRQAARIAHIAPSFEDTQARVLSQLRTLRSEKSLYLNAISEFKQSIRDRLELDELDQLEVLLSEFESKYPRISGIEVLKQDFDRYRLLQRSIRQRAWIEAIARVGETEYTTPPFREKVAEIRDQQLPPMEIAAQYQQASELWKKGDGEAANGILQSLTQGDWGAMAKDTLQRQLRVWDEYQSLMENKKDPDHSQQLLTLFVSLDPIEDSYFSNALRPEYEVYRAKALKEADQAFQEASAAWERYQENGRIMGLQRLEANISKKFRDQAEQLTKAYARSQQGVEIHSLLKHNMTGDQAAIHKAIVQECRLQIRSMRALGMVLEPKLLQDKIKILPDPDLSPGKRS